MEKKNRFSKLLKHWYDKDAKFAFFFKTVILRYPDREHFFSRAKKLRDSGMGISADLPKAIVERRKKLMDKFKAAKREGKGAFFQKSRARKTAHWRTLNNLFIYIHSLGSKHWEYSCKNFVLLFFLSLFRSPALCKFLVRPSSFLLAVVLSSSLSVSNSLEYMSLFYISLLLVIIHICLPHRCRFFIIK